VAAKPDYGLFTGLNIVERMFDNAAAGSNKIDLVLCDVFTSFMRASSRRSNHRLAAYAHRKWQDSRTTDTDNGAEYAHTHLALSVRLDTILSKCRVLISKIRIDLVRIYIAIVCVGWRAKL